MPRRAVDATRCHGSIPIESKDQDVAVRFQSHECQLQIGHYGPHLCWCGVTFHVAVLDD